MPLDGIFEIGTDERIRVNNSVTSKGAVQMIIKTYTEHVRGIVDVSGGKIKNQHQYITQGFVDENILFLKAMYPEFFIEGKDVEIQDFLEFISGNEIRTQEISEMLLHPIRVFAREYLGTSLVDGLTDDDIGDLVTQIEAFPAKLQDIPNLPDRYKTIHSGKVRETYQHPDKEDERMIIATNRISTHDVIHFGTIPGKGKALTKMSQYWFHDFTSHENTKDIPNQVIKGANFPDDFPDEYKESTVIVKSLKALPIEAIVRGYLYGSALKGYNSMTGKLETGEEIGVGREKCYKFDEPMFTPSTKSDSGDDNVSFETMVETLKEWLPENGYTNIDAQKLAEQVKDYSLRMYKRANEVSQEKGLILGDTKFEFGLDADGKLTLIDEACTADSSRLWTASTVKEGEEPESHDKQPVRDEIIEYWKENPDRNGRYYGEDEFIKYPVPLGKASIDKTDKNYDDVSRLFELAA